MKHGNFKSHSTAAVLTNNSPELTPPIMPSQYPFQVHGTDNSFVLDDSFTNVFFEGADSDSGGVFLG